MSNNFKYIIGIDEVGRGPIAGPVAVCAFVIKNDLFNENQKDKKLPPLRDSKKLTKIQRVKWYQYIKDSKELSLCDYAVSFVSSEMIDKFGINKCIQKALDESLKKVTTPEILFARSSDEGGQIARPSQKEFQSLFSIFLDGGLHAPRQYVNQETIIRGDEIHPIISLASIVAKVSRDGVMYNFAKKYPMYGFDKHVGYGTAFHYKALQKHGLCPIHRKSFIHIN